MRIPADWDAVDIRYLSFLTCSPLFNLRQNIAYLSFTGRYFHKTLVTGDFQLQQPGVSEVVPNRRVTKQKNVGLHKEITAPRALSGVKGWINKAIGCLIGQ